MKKAISFLGIMAFAVVMFVGCSQDNPSSPQEDSGFVKFNECTITESIGATGGPFINASQSNPVTLKAFSMAPTETTYERWYEVYTWATADARGAKKYTFVNKGCEGSNKKTEGAVPTAASKEPVTNITWRDAVIWCNAASEKDGKTPVYYLEGTTEYTSDKVLREAEGPVSTGDGKAEKAVIYESANGYRLPTEAEWEYAARGGDPASEAWSYNYAGTDSDDKLGDYAVYRNNSGNSDNTNCKTAAVGTKNANSAGLFDMNGNVFEMCWSKYSSTSSFRVNRGGSYFTYKSDTTVDYRKFLGTKDENKDSYTGFRVVISL